MLDLKKYYWNNCFVIYNIISSKIATIYTIEYNFSNILLFAYVYYEFYSFPSFLRSNQRCFHTVTKIYCATTKSYRRGFVLILYPPIALLIIPGCTIYVFFFCFLHLFLTLDLFLTIINYLLLLFGLVVL
jgi:hypothetical protein